MKLEVSNQTPSIGKINCLAGPCRLVRHETQAACDNEPDYVVLWCSHEGKAVIDMKECPDGQWKKNGSGYPVKTDPKAVPYKNDLIGSHEQNRADRTAYIS